MSHEKKEPTHATQPPRHEAQNLKMWHLYQGPIDHERYPCTSKIIARHTRRAKIACENVEVKNNVELLAHVEWLMTGKPSENEKKKEM